MPTYASFTGAHHAPYLTPGKRYLVVDAGQEVFTIRDDNGDILLCKQRNCAHLYGGDWTRHDEPDVKEPEPTQMQIEEGTLAELNARPGDVLEAVAWGDGEHASDFYKGVRWTVHTKHPLGYTDSLCAVYTDRTDRTDRTVRVISPASYTPPALGEMSDAEIGALLRAQIGGKTIQRWDSVWEDDDYPNWYFDKAYRIKPEPVRETVTLYTASSHPGLIPVKVGTIDKIDGVFQPGTFKLL